MFNNLYKNKKVLITGNTGFKGSWLSAWLLELGAKVYGISKDIPTQPSLFEILNLHQKTSHSYIDILDVTAIKEAILSIEPDFVFHLAAQPIVSLSYTNPIGTMATNIMGTAHVLDALRELKNPCVGIFISSDKCYENVEWKWGYRENDHLGGKDPYSASKGACELVIHSYYHSFFKNEKSPVRIASVRAGNVIGGGDWAIDRIIPDAIRAWVNKHSVELRNPTAIRPWQHVLEPLSGYLCLGQELVNNPILNGESYNFGPAIDQVYSVAELLEHFSQKLVIDKNTPFFTINESKKFHEAGYLKLNCDKALNDLKWKPAIDLVSTVELTAKWYKAFYDENVNMDNFTSKQIETYVAEAKAKSINWSVQ